MNRQRFSFINMLPFIILLLIILAIIKIILHYHNLSPLVNLKKTPATIIGYESAGGKGGTLAKFEFNYNKKEYFTTSGADNYVVGEKFLVKFDSIHPWKNQIMLDSPIFLENEKTGVAVGYLDRLINIKFFKRITFIYYIDGKKYEHSYEPGKDIENRYPKFKKGKKYLVKYWLDNPERAIIQPDQPTDLPLE